MLSMDLFTATGFVASTYQAISSGFKAAKSYVYKATSKANNDQNYLSEDEVINYEETQQGKHEAIANQYEQHVASGLLFAYTAYKVYQGDYNPINAGVACAAVGKSIWDVCTSSSKPKM